MSQTHEATTDNILQAETNLLHNISSSTISIILIFGSITFATISLGAKSFLLGDTLPIRTAIKASSHYSNGRRSITNKKNNTASVGALQPTFLSIYAALWQLMILGLILFVSYIMEHHPLYPHGVRSEFDSDYLLFLVIVVCFISGFSIQKCDDDDDDNEKEQTQQEEADVITSTSATLDGLAESIIAGGDENKKEEDAGEESDEKSDTSPSVKNMDTILLDEDIFNSKTASKNNNNNVSQKKSENKNTVEAATPNNDILNINQTLEWKGWMALCFLLYEYTNAGRSYNTSSAIVTADESSNDVVEIVNLGRIIPASFLFITGYSHFTYFYTTQDYSTGRVLRVLFRYNFLAFLLCLVHSNPYILYYVCPVHSYFFLGIFVLMRYKEKEGWNYNRWKLRMKLCMGGFVVFLLWDLDLGLFKLLHLPFFTVGPMGMRGAKLGPMWEWYFRTALDHWAAYFGMLFAANLPIVSLLQRKLESYSSTRTIISKSFVIAALGGAVMFWFRGPVLSATLHQYCRSHPYFCILSVLAYVYFRNICPLFRNHCFNAFRWNGEATLEIFLLHHHLFLTSYGTNDSNTILTLLPGWPKCNILFVSIIYIFICRKIHALTMYLRDVLLPAHDELMAGRVLGIMGLLFSSSYALSVTLERFHLLSPSTLVMICIFCGVLLYQSITDMTWRNYYTVVLSSTNNKSSASTRGGSRRSRRSNRSDNSRQYLVSNINTSDEDDYDDEDYYEDDHDLVSTRTAETDEELYEMVNNPVIKVSPPIIGAFFLFVLGLGWHALFLRGASTTLHLPPNCELYANYGEWIPVNVCNNFQRGIAYRQHHATGGFANYCIDDNTLYNNLDASPLKVWGWLENPSNSQCLFTTRDSSNMNTLLSDRNFVFIGDGMVKNLFHSFCRVLLSDKTAGAYDATAPKHADITKYFETTMVQYKWAPLAIDQLEKIKELRKLATEDVDLAPTLIVMGGGAWDRLHVWATDEDQESLRNTITKLSKEISNLDLNYGIPLVWMKPTTIHTKALNAEEKRSQMSEMALEEMRQLYSSWGIDAAVSFLLDGRVFTRQRVQESYDGIHYPIDVYDAGVQILANAMDWLIPPSIGDTFSSHIPPPEPGSMANPSLGLMMVCFAFIGLFFFDGYLGFSYLSSLVVNGVMPNDLYEEAFWPIHRRWKLPLSNNAGGFHWMQSLMTWGGGGDEVDSGKDERIGLRANGGISVVGTDLELVEELRAR